MTFTTADKARHLRASRAARYMIEATAFAAVLHDVSEKDVPLIIAWLLLAHVDTDEKRQPAQVRADRAQSFLDQASAMMAYAERQRT